MKPLAERLQGAIAMKPSPIAAFVIRRSTCARDDRWSRSRCLAWSLVRDGLVDKVVQYLAPLLVGGARAPGVIAGGGFAPIANALRLDVAAVDRVGDDLRVEAYVHRDR